MGLWDAAATNTAHTPWHPLEIPTHSMMYCPFGMVWMVFGMVFRDCNENSCKTSDTGEP